MLEQISPLWDVFLKNQMTEQPLVLATLVKTEGSSYKKAGTMMLIEQNGSTHGLISGGCLEADVAEHASRVFETHQAELLEYDLSDESIFGLGAGCDGSILIVLQLLQDDYLPFSALDPTPEKAQALDLCIEFDVDSRYPVGSFHLTKNKRIIASPKDIQVNPTRILKFFPPPHILIFGSGSDTKPLLDLIKLMHWHVTMVDHRKERLKQIQVDHQIAILHARNDAITDTLQLLKFDAAIIMTHNLERDADYLQMTAETNCDFIGLLGPPNRRDKILHKSKIKLTEIEHRLRAPVGLNLGGRMPENIAVAIVAQLQSYIYQT